MAGMIQKLLGVMLLGVVVGALGVEVRAQGVLKSVLPTQAPAEAPVEAKVVAPATKPATQPGKEGATKRETGVAPGATTQGAATQAAATQPDEAMKGLACPRATMATFLDGMARLEIRDAKGSTAAWTRVQSTMDASLVTDPGTLRAKAEALRGVLDRIGEPEPGDLPGPAEVEQTSMARYRYFPKQPDHAWVWKELKAFGKSPDGSITFTRDESGAWRFSPKTVAGIEALYSSMKDLPPRETRPGGKIVGMVGPTFEQTTWVGWVVLLGAIFGSMAVGRGLQAGLLALSRRQEAQGHRARAAVLDDVAGPLSFAFLTAGLHFGLWLVYMEPDLEFFASRMVKFLVMLAVAWLIYNLVDLIDIGIRQFSEKSKSKLDDMVGPLIRKSLRVFLVVVFLLFVAQNLFGLNITSWLTGLGIAGLAVSLAAQDSIKNMFGSMVVFFDRPFGVGDWIKFEGFDGTVEEIGLRSSRLRTLAGHVVTVPNMKFNDNCVENMSAQPYIRRSLNVKIPYDVPVAKMEEAVGILRKMLSEAPVSEPFDLEKWPARVAFDVFNADSLNIQVYYWYMLSHGRDYWTYLAHAEDFNFRLMKAFEAAGIKFAFPRQTTYADDAKVAKVAAVEGVKPV
jgi:MscS family membrane protein